MAIYSFDKFIPVVHPTAYVHPQATVIGDVFIGRDVYIGPGARIRGDWGRIIIKDGCNVQENCVIHMFPGVTVILEEMAHIGHGAMIHGAQIGRNVLIGMNTVVMDEVEIGDDSIIGAMSFVPQGMTIPSRSLAVGNPAQVIKKLTDEMIAWKTQGTELYMKLPRQMHETCSEVEPLLEPEPNRPEHPTDYFPLKKTRR
ncbi:acyltransferase [Schleiferia thermophila]|jgi:phenylacetic acid degradation protein/carnitine operon protein CaiE|uniref:acyltransferase n=1 Tax=Schleiferia thermophila TaxID=884107 RepID=UPI002FD9E514